MPRPALIIRLTHTGVYADGRPNVSPVQVTDLDVGYENQHRKVPVYVPPAGHIDINASSRSMLSFEQGGIDKFTNAGLLQSQMFYIPESYTTGTLPAATGYPAGVFVWNTTEETAYWSTGVGWTVGKAVPTGPAGGDLSGTYPNPTVAGIQGIPVESGLPTNGDTHLYNSLTNRWEHAPIVFGGGPPVGPAGGDLGGLYPNPGVTGLQLEPLPAKTADGFLKRNAANTGWEEVAYGSIANTVCEGNDPRLSDSRTPTGAAGGDLNGTYPNPTVDGLQGNPVDNAAPATDEVLAWDGAKWTPTDLGVLASGLKTVCGSFSDSLDQTVPTSPGTLAVQYNTVELAGGVTVANNLSAKPTRLTVPVDGVYSFDISPQMAHSGGVGVTIYFWASINDTPIPRSASSFEMGNNNNRTLPFLTLMVPMLAGQYLEWIFTASGNNTTLEAFPAAGVVPDIPSVIANVRRVGALP